MDSGTECVANTELHETGKELSDATKENGQTKDGLVGTNTGHGVRPGKTKRSVSRWQKYVKMEVKHTQHRTDISPRQMWSKQS